MCILVCFCAWLCVCVCVCALAYSQSKNSCLVCVRISALSSLLKCGVSGGRRQAAVNNNCCRSKPLFTSEGSISRCRGQTLSEEDSPSYKQTSFSQQRDNERDCMCVRVHVHDFCSYLHVMLLGWNKESTDSSLWAVFIRCGTENFGSPAGMWVFMHFHVGNIRWKPFRLGSFKSNKKRETKHPDTLVFSSH